MKKFDPWRDKMELINKPYLLFYVVGYFIIMLIIGHQSSKKIHNSDDFVLAGKSLGPIVLMGTMLATYTGGGTVTGGGNSLAYNNGLWSGIFFCIPALITIIVLSLISGKIRAMGKYTVSEILEEKYGKEAKILSSLIIMLAFVGILSYQYKGLAFVLNATTGIPIQLGIIISAGLIVILTTMGGLVTVAYTDAISASLILVSVVIAVPMSISVAGGWSNVVANSTPTSLTLSSGLNFFQIIGNYLPLLILGLGDQNMYQRIVAARGGKDAKTGMLGWFIGIIIVMPCVAVIAFVSKSIFGSNIQPGMALISMTTVLPAVLGGVLLAGATAFIVTTGTSYLIVERHFTA
jgi:SSS family solute:Na+ symporter